MATGTPLKTTNYKPITTDAPSNADVGDSAKCYHAYPQDPMREQMIFFEMQSDHMDAITGPVTVNVWVRLPEKAESEAGDGELEWSIVDEWLLQSISGPVVHPLTINVACDYIYLQIKTGSDALNAMLGYEPDQGVA